MRVEGSRAVAVNSGNRRTRVLIVCPTATGGHLEHALEMALAAMSDDLLDVAVVSRPGARAYADSVGAGHVLIHEDVPPLVDDSIAGLRRQVRQAGQLVREQLAIRRLLAPNRVPAVLVLEEPRYPWMRLMRPFGLRLETSLVLHNVIPHEAAGGGSEPGLLTWLRRRCIDDVDRVVVHGERQLEAFRDRFSRPVEVCRLPDGTQLEFRGSRSPDSSTSPGGFLCLGEIRENKGISTAIDAVGDDLPLRVVGRSPEPEYFDLISVQSAGRSNISMERRFLEPGEFAAELRAARALVLPYLDFAAQSGVLARARAVGSWVVAADIPSLREQAMGYGRVVFFEPGDAAALRAAMLELADRPSEPVDDADDGRQYDEWDGYFRFVRGGSG